MIFSFKNLDPLSLSSISVKANHVNPDTWNKNNGYMYVYVNCYIYTLLNNIIVNNTVR